MFALVDSGAQVNILSYDLRQQLEVSSISGPTVEIKSVSQHRIEVKEWVEAQFMMSPAIRVKGVFAVVSNIRATMILGLPFLIGNRMMHDFRIETLHTSRGSIGLWTLDTQQQPRISAVVVAKITDEEMIDSVLFNATLLDDVQKDVLKSVLEKYLELFKDNRRGEIKGTSHSLRLLTDRPVVSRPRPHSAEQQVVISEEIAKMLADGVIVPSASPYSSEIVMVKKKTGDWRMCIDFRPLNEVTVSDQYPLPRIQELIRAVKGARYFVALDLRSGYWQIPMDRKSQPMTAFRTEKGLYEFRVMPFGLKTAPATFQRNMDFLLGDMRYKGVLVYIDDILIHDRTFDGCIDLVRLVFERLHQANVTINLQKSTFFQESFEYLGHIISHGTLKPNPKKVKAIQGLVPPSTVKEVRSLLGLCGYVQHFIPQYSELTAPITDLLKGTKTKGTKKDSTKRIEWTGQHDAALNELKAAIQTAVLNIPIDGETFVVRTDASDRAVGAVLFIKRDENLLPVHFAGRKLQAAENNYSTREKEALAIIFALKKFDYFIKGRRFILQTDHSSLKYLLQAKEGKLARWALIIPEFDIEIEWIKGVDNELADLLTYAKSQYLALCRPSKTSSECRTRNLHKRAATTLMLTGNATTEDDYTCQSRCRNR